MQKATVAIFEILKRILIVGFGIQILLGLLWMCGQIPTVQEFGESPGYLYPFAVQIIGRIAETFGIPVALPFYFLQLGFALYSTHAFLMGIGGSKGVFHIFCVMSVLTLPFALQCHLALLPYSLAGSLLLLQITHTVKACKEKKFTVTMFVSLSLFWLLQGLLLPEYAIFAGIIWFAAFIMAWVWTEKEKKQKRILYLLLTVCFVGIFWTVGNWDGSLEKGVSRDSIAIHMASRFTVGRLAQLYDNFPETVKEVMSYEEVQHYSYSHEEWQTELRDQITEALGDREGERFFWKIAEAGRILFGRQVWHDILIDGICYGFSPITLQIQLMDRGCASYSGRNYEIMAMKNPSLTRIYVNYSCWWYAVCLVVGCFMGIICLFQKALANFKNVSVLLTAFFCLLTAAVMIVWYVLQGSGMMDYKKTMIITVFWAVGVMTISGEAVDVRE